MRAVSTWIASLSLRLVWAMPLALRLEGSYMPLVLAAGSVESKLSREPPPLKRICCFADKPPPLVLSLAVVSRILRARETFEEHKGAGTKPVERIIGGSKAWMAAS